MTHEFSYDAKRYALSALKLHHLFAAGQGDSDEADKVREQLEYYEDSMPAEDWKFLKNLAGDLYMMQNKDMYRQIDDGIRQERRNELFGAIQTEDWETVLDRLMDGLRLPRAVVAHYRSRAYGAFPEVSAVFQGIADEELRKVYVS